MEKKHSTLAELSKQFGSEQIPYARLLETAEWEKTREKITKRDNWSCTKCKKDATDWHPSTGYFWIVEGKSYDLEQSDKPYHLEVHHKYYIHNKYPWQYADEALVTLCNWCHNDLHQKTMVPYYNSQGDALGYTPCSRCCGVGSLAEYSHVQSGVCFRCAGARYEELIGK